MKEHTDTAEIRLDLMKSVINWSPDPKELPSIVPAKGLSAERQWYLFDHIREFCPDEDKDITCPLPCVPKPNGAPGTPVQHTRPPHDDPVEPPAKRKRLCGICKQEGHNSRSCPNKAP